MWTDVAELTPERAGQAVLVRARVHTVRGKGKSAFLVLRQATATVQAALFVDDVNVSKGMVKYASAIPRESIVDVEATLVLPQALIEACSQSQVRGAEVWSCPASCWAWGMRIIRCELLDAAMSCCRQNCETVHQSRLWGLVPALNWLSACCSALHACLPTHPLGWCRSSCK